MEILIPLLQQHYSLTVPGRVMLIGLDNTQEIMPGPDCLELVMCRHTLLQGQLPMQEDICLVLRNSTLLLKMRSAQVLIKAAPNLTMLQIYIILKGSIIFQKQSNLPM